MTYDREFASSSTYDPGMQRHSVSVLRSRLRSLEVVWCETHNEEGVTTV